MQFTRRWEAKSSIRNRPQRFLASGTSKYFFPPLEQPLCHHPKIVALGEDVKRYLLVQSSFLFMKTIFINETRVINTIVNRIIVGDSTVKVPREIEQNLLTVMIDENYHAYVANDFIDQVSSTTGIRPIEFLAESSLSQALISIRSTIAYEHCDVFDIIAACIAENSITKELISISRDRDVDPLFYLVNDDHIIDEGRHCRIFSHVLARVWGETSAECREAIGPRLPIFISKYLHRDIAQRNHRLLLSSLSLSKNDVDEILYDTYPDHNDESMSVHNPVVKNIMTLLTSAKVLEHGPTARAFNITSKDNTSKNVVELFRRQVEETPHCIAVVDGEHHITYRKLDELSTNVCGNLLARGARKGAIVATIHGHGYEYVALVLGIMKAGMVLLPFAHDVPHERLHTIMDEAEPCMIVVDNEDNFGEWYGAPLTLTKRLLMPAQQCEVSVEIAHDDLAYIIYTSGSTGEPKGVMISHSSYANFLTSIVKVFPINPCDRVLQFAPLGFDPSLAEIGGSLSVGATLCIKSRNMLDSSEHFFAECRRMDISILNLPTSLWYHLIRDVEDVEEMLPKSLNTVVIGGEAVTALALRHWYERVKAPIKLLNTYGPTETTIAVTACELNNFPALREQESLIGTAIANSSLFVLDENQRPLSVGMVGELYVGGPGVSRGYFKRPALTDERFVRIDDIFSNGLLYKTGDRVKWVHDPYDQNRLQLSFIGRSDKQIKIRGFRVELEEIEQCITKFCDATNVRVLFHNEELVAFLETSSTKLVVDELRASMKNALPEYMQPNRYVIVSAWPMTRHGKVDEKKLLSMVASSTNLDEVEIVDDVLKRLSLLWMELLKTKSIGPTDHFFYIGGHSLLALRLLALINNQFHARLTVRNIFENPRLDQMTDLIKQRMNEHHEQVHVSSTNDALLSSFQESLWVSDKLQGGKSINYNIAYGIHFKGHLNYVVLEKAVNFLIARHQLLRSIFPMRDGRLMQIATEGAFVVRPEAIASREYANIALAEVRTPFDLSTKTAFRVRLFRITHDYHILLINHHHIIHDGHSIGIFLRELLVCYEAFLQNESPILPQKNIDFADVAHTLRERADGGEYWREALKNYRPLHFPFRKTETLRTGCGARHRVALPAHVVDALRALCVSEECTLFIGLLAVFNLVFHEEGATEDVAIATIMSTRNYDQDNEIFGPFVNTVILRQRVNFREDFRTLLRRTRQTVIDAESHRFFPLEMITRALRLERLPGDNRLFDVLINFHSREQIITHLESPNLRGEIEYIDGKTAKFGMMIDLFENADGVDVVFEHCVATFEHEDVERIAARYVARVLQVVNEAHPHPHSPARAGEGRIIVES